MSKSLELPSSPTTGARKSVNIRETDNGFVISLYGQGRDIELVSTSLAKSLRTAAVFFKAEEGEKK